ncbi:hypothetical protein P7C73_g452, partial [Tremellales sp. Uapishka_1]
MPEPRRHQVIDFTLGDDEDENENSANDKENEITYLYAIGNSQLAKAVQDSKPPPMPKEKQDDEDDEVTVRRPRRYRHRQREVWDAMMEVAADLDLQFIPYERANATEEVHHARVDFQRIVIMLVLNLHHKDGTELFQYNYFAVSWHNLHWKFHDLAVKLTGSSWRTQMFELVKRLDCYLMAKDTHETLHFGDFKEPRSDFELMHPAVYYQFKKLQTTHFRRIRDGNSSASVALQAKVVDVDVLIRELEAAGAARDDAQLETAYANKLAAILKCRQPELDRDRWFLPGGRE